MSTGPANSALASDAGAAADRRLRGRARRGASGRGIAARRRRGHPLPRRAVSRSAPGRRCSRTRWSSATPTIPTTIGRRTVFGHRCLVIGATVGDLCEIGNASILMPGARLGDRVFLGEGTLVPAGMTLPDDVVAVGPAGPGRADRVGRRPAPARRSARRRPLAPAAHRDHRREHTGDERDGPALRVPRHRPDASPRRRRCSRPRRSPATSSSANARSSAPASRSSATPTDRCASATTSRSSRTPSCTCSPTTTSSSTTA